MGVKLALEKGDVVGIAKRLSNVLETVTIPEYPQIGKLKESMLEYGAMASLMSGSGPTVFGLVENKGAKPKKLLKNFAVTTMLKLL